MPQRAGVRAVDQIAQLGPPSRWRGQERGVLGEVPLDVPGAADGRARRGLARGLGGSAEVDVDAADP